MDDVGRQRLNLRAIGESLDSALRDLTPVETERILARANLLLDAARSGPNSPDIEREIEALQANLDRRSTTRASGRPGK